MPVITRRSWAAAFLCLGLALLTLLASAGVAMASDDDTVVVTAREIEALQAHTMADILNTVPGITAGSSSVSIHGSTKVRVFVDGRPLNDPSSSHGGIKWDLITPAEVEKIEILRGKGGVRYGQDASGGVILITSKGTSHLSGHLKTYAGSDDRFYANTNLQVTRGPWQAGVTGGYDTSGGYLTNNDNRQWQTGAKLGYVFNPEVRLNLSADYTEEDRGSAGYPEYPTPYYRQESEMAAYAMQAEAHGLKSNTVYNLGNRHNLDPSLNLDKRIEVGDFRQELDSGLDLGDWGSLGYGAAFGWGQANGTDFADQDETSLSLYAVETYPLETIPLTLALGLRGSLYSAFDTALNPEVKGTWRAKAWRATLAYARTNNTPSFYQRYNETSTTRPNPDLDMETADNYSLSLSTMLGQGVGVSATIFHNKLSDRITYVLGDDGVGGYTNFGRTSANGGDLSLSWKASERINVKASYSYLDAENDETGLQLPCKPLHRTNINLGYRPIDPLSTVLVISGHSKAYRNTSNTIEVDENVLVDVRAEYSFTRFSLFAEITNLLNTSYLYVDGMEGPPRTWFAGINLRI